MTFLNKRFANLSAKDRNDYFGYAWDEYKRTGRAALVERFVTGLVFAQMSVNVGIKRYGREAELQLMKEFAQLLEYKVFHGRKADELTPEQKKAAANMISIVETKTNRGHTEENPVLKARNVYNGSVERGLYTKEETASPTVGQNSFLVTAMIDTVKKKGQGNHRCKRSVPQRGDQRFRVDENNWKVSGPVSQAGPDIGKFYDIRKKEKGNIRTAGQGAVRVREIGFAMV